jgi:hypothetical protein
MFALLLISSCLFIRSLAKNSTLSNLEGWQYDDDSRSSWDILWTCLTTVFACTWAAVHMHVPQRGAHPLTSSIEKGLAWIAALLAPEMMVFQAAADAIYARKIIKKCNKAFDEREKVYWSIRQGNKKPSSSGVEPDEGRNRHWAMVQGFCIYMHGFQIQTKDDWLYTIESKNVAPLIEAGVIQSYNLREAEIKDRAKVDASAKLLTVIQSTWTIINILARAAYSLPISLIEITTVAYVICAAFTYAMWWAKPKDMQTPITMLLPYTRESDEMPAQVRNILDSQMHCWQRLSGTHVDGKKRQPKGIRNEGLRHELQIQPRHQPWSTNCSDGSTDKLSTFDEITLTVCAMIGVQVFCAIHIAA